MNSLFRSDLILLITSLIWGFGFVAQKSGMNYLGPHAFNGARYTVGLVCLSLILILRKRRRVMDGFLTPKWFRASLAAGTCLFLGSTFQQIGIQETTAGKAGFVTGLYVVIVPLAGLMLGHRATPGIWLGAGLAAVGLYLLSVQEEFGVNRGDMIVLIGAFFWAAHVLVIDRFTGKLSALHLSLGQVAACATMSWAAAIPLEALEWEMFKAAALPIGYLGVFSIATAYTLQIIGQKRAHPAYAAIIFSLEAVFGVMAGWLLLGEQLSIREGTGCALMFGGMLCAQLPVTAWIIQVREKARQRADG